MDRGSEINGWGGRAERSVRRWLTAAALLLLAGPAGAGTVLVPLAGEGAAGGLRYAASLAVTNPTAQPLFVSLRFRSAIVDGVLPGADPETVVEGVGPGETRFFNDLSRGVPSLGLLEVTGDDALRVDVRVQVTDLRGRRELVALPVLRSRDLTAAGTTTVVTGFYRDGSRRMTLGLVNGAEADNACLVQFVGSRGEPLSVEIALTLPPRAFAYWSDALGAAGVPIASEGRFHMTCERPSFAFGLFVDLATGELVRRDPSLGLVSTLAESSGGGSGGSGGSGGGDPGGPVDRGVVVVETGPGLVRMRVDGVVHAPIRGRDAPVWIHALDLPGIDVIDSITASVVVETGAWGTQRDRPQHHLLQISQERWGDGGWDFWIRPDREAGQTMRGLLASRGRGAGNEVVRDTEVGLPAVYPVTAEQRGDTIRVEGLSITRGVQTPRSGPLLVQLGATLGTRDDPKVPSWGWVWRDLLVEVRGR